MAETTAEKTDAKVKKVWTPPVDPLVRVRVDNRDLADNENENVPWSFVFRRPAVERPDGSMCRFKIVSYPLANGKEYELPESVVTHLEAIAYPVRKHKPDQPEGQGVPISGSRRRFTVSRL